MIEIPDSVLDAFATEIAERVASKLELHRDESTPWMRTEEAIEYSRLKPGTFRELMAQGRLRSHGGKTKVFHKAELDEDLGYAGGGNVTPIRRSA